MGSFSDIVDKLSGYEDISSELKLFYRYGVVHNDSEGYTAYVKSVGAYEAARRKYPRGAEIEDMRNV